MAGSTQLSPLKKEIENLMVELSETLAQEYEVLRKRDIEGLEAAIERKSTILAKLESASGAIDRAREALGSGDLLEDWPELHDIAADCAVANRTNGGAIELNRGLVANLLDTLYGVSRTERTYDAHGHLDQQDAARSVGRAWGPDPSLIASRQVFYAAVTHRIRCHR